MYMCDLRCSDLCRGHFLQKNYPGLVMPLNLYNMTFKEVKNENKPLTLTVKTSSNVV